MKLCKDCDWFELDLFEDEEEYKIAKYKVTYKLLEDDVK